jgi:arylsulfatase A-like enzyme
MFDGGTRVPFILRWTGTVAPGETSTLVSHADFLASFASTVGVPLPEDAGPDSLNLLDAMLGQSAVGRKELAVEGTQAKTVLRQGHWTYIPPQDGPAVAAHTGIETGNAPMPQLYDLWLATGQITNVAEAEPARTAAMSARLDAVRRSTRTRAT